MNFFLTTAAIFLGFLLDLLIGDPHGLWHPVRLIGAMITGGEHVLRRLFSKTPGGERAAGSVLAVMVPLLSFAVPFFLLWAAGLLHPGVRLALESIFCWQILATKSLKVESMRVYACLKAHDLPAARRAVSMIVGRDTEKLTEEQVAKAAVETVAENTSDGVIAPLFFLMLGGAPLGFFYKAVNTLDSMIGYKNERYLHFGRTAAKLDDVCNFLPARISAGLMIATAKLLGFDASNAKRIFLRDRFCHASPNSAQTEAVCAGALQIQLAGDAWYFGKLHKKKTIGDALRAVEPEDIARANRLLYGTAVLGLVLAQIMREAAFLLLGAVL